MRLLFILLTIAVVVLTIITVVFAILAILSAGGNVLFPGLGLIVALPLLVFLLAVVDTVLIFLAFLMWRAGGKKSGGKIK
jgi:hypothetical protein